MARTVPEIAHCGREHQRSENSEHEERPPRDDGDPSNRGRQQAAERGQQHEALVDVRPTTQGEAGDDERREYRNIPDGHNHE